MPKLKQENPRRATRSRVIELTDRICVCRHGATVRMHLVHGGRYIPLCPYGGGGDGDDGEGGNSRRGGEESKHLRAMA